MSNRQGKTPEALAKQRAALVKNQFKKGQSGNPLGGKLHNPELTAIRRLTAREVAEVGSYIINLDMQGLADVAKDRSASALKVMISAVAISIIKKGDASALNALLDRIVGRVPTQVDVTSQGQSMGETLTDVLKTIRGMNDTGTEGD